MLQGALTVSTDGLLTAWGALSALLPPDLPPRASTLNPKPSGGREEEKRQRGEELRVAREEDVYTVTSTSSITRGSNGINRRIANRMGCRERTPPA